MAGGKKLAVAVKYSEDEDVFVPRYTVLSLFMFDLTTFIFSPTRDSPKKACAKEPSTSLKDSESVHQRQIKFDAAVYVSILIA